LERHDDGQLYRYAAPDNNENNVPSP